MTLGAVTRTTQVYRICTNLLPTRHAPFSRGSRGIPQTLLTIVLVPYHRGRRESASLIHGSAASNLSADQALLFTARAPCTGTKCVDDPDHGFAPPQGVSQVLCCCEAPQVSCRLVH